MFTRPVWAEISRRNLVANFKRLRKLAGADADLLAVVKANAYGHGVIECSPLLVAAGAKWIGVTCVEEGVRARAACPDARVLVMSGLWKHEADVLLAHRLTPVVWEDFHIDLLLAAAARMGAAPASIPVHLELDVGMARQGVRITHPDGMAALWGILTRLRGSSPLQLEGLMTHFTAPETLDDAATDEQIAYLTEGVRMVASQGLRPQWLSAGNSATLLGQRDVKALRDLAKQFEARLLARPGLALYGYSPRFPDWNAPAEEDLKPVLSWKTQVTSLRTLEAGDAAGYNSTFRARRATRLGLLPCGYADGVNRLLSNRGEVLIRGQRVPIAGRVSMDQTIVDVTDVVGVDIGDEAVLIGSQETPPDVVPAEVSITAYDIADLVGTIPYEVLCAINSRVPRKLVD